MIEFDHLTKEYGGIKIINDLTFTIKRGEIFGLLGPNGAGKTTTILMMIGLIIPTKGTCRINGLDINDAPLQIRQMIGYMPDDVGFYTNMTAEQNLDYFGRLFSMESSVRQERIATLLEMVNLSQETKNVGEFSKGMMQRLGIAKALLNDPTIIILDEPTANLDPEGIIKYRGIIKNLADQEKTVVISSHVLNEIKKLCTSFGILFNGQLIFNGTWNDLSTLLDNEDMEHIKITIVTLTPMPDIIHPDIMDIQYFNDRKKAVVIAKSDIREILGEYLYSKGIKIREIRREYHEIEDLFISYCRMHMRGQK